MPPRWHGPLLLFGDAYLSVNDWPGRHLYIKVRSFRRLRVEDIEAIKIRRGKIAAHALAARDRSICSPARV
jgi:hypothetical protein